MHFTLFSFKLLAAFITLIAALLGGIWPLWRHYRQVLSAPQSSFDRLHAAIEFPSGEAVAAGIFLAAGLLHMLAESTRGFVQAGYHYPFSYLIAAIVFLILLGLEHVAVHIKAHRHVIVSSVAILTALMLIIHSLVEGLAIGVSASLSVVLIVFLAIIAHKSAASFALAIALAHSTLRPFVAILCFALFVSMTPLGVMLGSYVLTLKTDFLLTPIFTALAAGTFLYIGTLHGFERASLIHRCCNLKEFFLMLAGFGVMAIVAIWT